LRSALCSQERTSDSLNKIQTPVMDKIKEQFRDTYPSIVADTKAFLKENADQKVGEIDRCQNC
jgi:hypothetical protein